MGVKNLIYRHVIFINNCRNLNAGGNEYQRIEKRVREKLKSVEGSKREKEIHL